MHLIQNQLAILTSSKGTTEKNTHNFRLKNKLTTDDYGKIIIKIQ